MRLPKQQCRARGGWWRKPERSALAHRAHFAFFSRHLLFARYSYFACLRLPLLLSLILPLYPLSILHAERGGVVFAHALGQRLCGTNIHFSGNRVGRANCIACGGNGVHDSQRLSQRLGESYAPSFSYDAPICVGWRHHFCARIVVSQH